MLVAATIGPWHVTRNTNDLDSTTHPVRLAPDQDAVFGLRHISVLRQLLKAPNDMVSALRSDLTRWTDRSSGS